MGTARHPLGRARRSIEVAVGHPLVEEYLEFLNVRARPNTRLAVAFDLKVFFSFVDKTPVRVTSADVMAFIRSQRAGGKVVRIDGSAALSSRTIRAGCPRCRAFTPTCWLAVGRR